MLELDRSRWWILAVVSLLWASVLLTACQKEEEPTPELVSEGSEPVSFELRSGALGQGETIPQAYTCDGPDRSPPLSWDDPPVGTQSLALIVDDPDAPAKTWVHWVLYDLPADVRQLPEGLPADETLAGGGSQGKNNFGNLGYGGPCPPKGKPHRYFFRLYALDTRLDLAPGASKKELLDAMAGHVIGQAELMGGYER